MGEGIREGGRKEDKGIGRGQRVDRRGGEGEKSIEMCYVHAQPPHECDHCVLRICTN